MIELRPLGSLSLTGPACEELPAILRQPKRLALLAYLVAATPRGFCRRAQVHVDLPVRWGHPPALTHRHRPLAFAREI